jgi:hypothetical protein
MKKCSQCSATYNDDMSFCLNDGASLDSMSEADDMPATVMYNPPHQTSQNEAPAPTMMASVPPPVQQQQQSYQPQPQFGQPQFGNQPPFNPQAAAPKKSYLGYIIAGVVVVLGFFGIVGALGLYMYSQSDDEVVTTSATTNKLAIPKKETATPAKETATPKKSTSTYSQSTNQGEGKNGFKTVSTEDVTANNFFPGANATSAATFEKGSQRIISFMSVYDTPDDAKDAFETHLAQIKSEGRKVTAKQDNYVYYNKTGTYSTAFWVDNQLYEYNANNQDTLYKFAE